MPLSSATKQAIEITYSILISRIKAHENRTILLTPETLADCQNDVEILDNLLSGKYERSLQAIIGKDIRTMANIAEEK